jgi:hypothetical protein
MRLLQQVIPGARLCSGADSVSASRRGKNRGHRREHAYRSGRCIEMLRQAGGLNLGSTSIGTPREFPLITAELLLLGVAALARVRAPPPLFGTYTDARVKFGRPGPGSGSRPARRTVRRLVHIPNHGCAASWAARRPITGSGRSTR